MVNVGKIHAMHCILLSAEKCLNKEIKGIKTEAMEGTKVNCNTCVKANPKNEDAATIKRMRVWIRKARIFRAHSGDSKQQDIRNIGVIRKSK